MSPRKPHRDRLGDKVAHSFLPEDLRRAIPGLPKNERDVALFWLDTMAGSDKEVEEHTIEWVARRILSNARLDPQLRARLVAYLGDRVPSLRGRCLWCLKDLPPREPGQPGRIAKYCGPNHRQTACRARRRTRLRQHE
ncbi:hypothetical protein ACFXO9_31540 [Nocardia tengchongensis]|uniref:hypothetical protein n=1 Tax=Nocardia tengchongensis TaxID=2055889 RepID=UPI0036BEA3D5